MKDFVSINYHVTSPIFLWQGSYEEREERVLSYVRGVSLRGVSSP
jgi:hypothetical protein